MDAAGAHLGGYISGGDEATYFPELWDWLVKEQGVRSVIDVGCGDGVALGYFHRLGAYVVGVEGTPQQDERILQHDYSGGSFEVMLPYGITEAHLVWCCEFVEHVEERYIPNFLQTFQQAPLVLMTHAFPGQPGYHHVNCRNPEYWVGVMAGIGYRYDEEFTQQARERAAANTSAWNHFTRSGLAFRRKT
jgi:hypothetical protein